MEKLKPIRTVPKVDISSMGASFLRQGIKSTQMLRQHVEK